MANSLLLVIQPAGLWILLPQRNHTVYYSYSKLSYCSELCSPFTSCHTTLVGRKKWTVFFARDWWCLCPHRWSLNGTLINLGLDRRRRLSGGNLIISSLDRYQDVGMYQCMAFNTVGAILSRRASLQFACKLNQCLSHFSNKWNGSMAALSKYCQRTPNWAGIICNIYQSAVKLFWSNVRCWNNMEAAWLGGSSLLVITHANQELLLNFIGWSQGESSPPYCLRSI